MKVIFPELEGRTFVQGAELEAELLETIRTHLPEIDHELVQDLSHISHFANYVGGMTAETVTYQKDNLYKLDYTYKWEINWSCADQMEEGVINDKIRFTLADNGEVEFKILKLDA